MNNNQLLNDIVLKDNIYFKDKLFERNVEKNINFSGWKLASLHVPDSIHLGPTREVDILYFEKNEYTYLQTIQSINKNEFEIIFDFKIGEFEKGRTISILSKHLIIRN